MNRQQHLLQTAQRVAAWPHHAEHLVVDWSSRSAVDRSQLPRDPRLRLERVEGESRWNLCRAYNLAARLARGNLLLKLDADCWPEEFDPNLFNPSEHSLCWFGSGPDGRLGQFLISRSVFDEVGGFNEVLQGYGFDDKDLKARLVSYGHIANHLPQSAIGVLPHSIHERASRDDIAKLHHSAFQDSLSRAFRQTTATSNRVAAAHFPWTSYRSPSQYVRSSSGVWNVLDHTIPRASDEAEDELLRLRRVVFWSSFLCIPEVIVRRLPLKLLGNEVQGNFRLAWWHKLYWHVIRRFICCIVRPLEPGFWQS